MASASAALNTKKTYEIVQQGIKELYCPSDSINPDVDIVAVPGLGAPPEESWRSADPKLEFNWLKDKEGLAKEFPRARVLLYMYQSAWTGPLKVRQFMSNLAMSLLHCLKEKRKDCPRRPIVFIGHSMGGLVIAKAVAFAESRREHFGKMFEAMTGCIFFGTPFDGAEAAAVALMVSHINDIFKLDQVVTSKLVELMQTGDETLRDLKNEFMRLTTKMSPKIELLCFYEEKPTDWHSPLGLPSWIPIPKKYANFVTRESATLTGVDSLGLARTHRELVKFDSFKDTVYQIVRSPLKYIINSAPLIAKNRFNSTRGIDREVVKNVLSALEGVQVDRKRKRLAQNVISSSWILQEAEYQEWLKIEDQQLDCLWIRGPEGKGKLGATLAAIDHIEDTIRHEEAQNSGQAANMIAYFLCDSTTEGSSPEELLKSLLRQLVNQQEALAAYAKQFITTKKDSATRGRSQAGQTVENLWQSLQDMLTDELIGTVYLVINNLHSMDEEADSVKKLMALIAAEFEGSGYARAQVRWLFTSQARHSIQQTLNSSKIRLIDLDDDKYGNQVQQELKLHAQKRIASLGMEKGYNKALTYFAGSLIGKRAQNTQWIDITIIQLAELPTDARDLKVRSMLERIPQDLSSLLNRAWLSVLDPKDEQLEEIKEMLRTLIITYEEPTEDELAVLTGLSHDLESRAHLCALVEKCRPLLTLRKAPSRIGFMNSVVKAHLLENAEKLLGLSAEEIRWQHGIVALRNFSHLIQGYTEPPKSADAEDRVTVANDEQKVETEAFEQQPVVDNGPGVDTATEALTAEFEEQSENEEEEEIEYGYYDSDLTDSEEEEEEMMHEEEHVDEMDVNFLSSYAIKHWLHHASKATADIADTLSQEGDFWKEDSDIRKSWLKDYNSLTSDFQDITLEGLTALHVASSIGFTQLVSALLKNGHQGSLSIRDKMLNTPLHLAAFFGRPNICEVLLNNGAKVDDGQEIFEQTPLSMAASKGHCRVMIKLLNRGANPNALAKEGGPVINEAIVSGNLEAVRLLVEHGALLTHDDNDRNDAPLALSALLSDLTMFTFLLEACADKIPHKEYNKAFIASASAGRLEVTKRLLGFEHDRHTFQEALEAAASEENWEILLLILESSSGLDCDNVFFQIATSSENQDKLLTAIWKHTNGNVSQKSIDNSLYEAVDIEKEDTVILLLDEFNADPDATGEEYGNALTAAAFDGTVHIVRKLLDHGADVNSPNGWALQTAAEQGHLEVVELLIERGANINASVNEAKYSLATALQGACDAGQTDIVSILLKNGANPDLGGGPETCPILAACRRGEADILEKLIDAGATIDRFGGPDNSSPLVVAAGTLYEDSIEKLLNAGANINLADDDGDTALIVAARSSDAQLVAFLLSKGADITHVSKRNVNALQSAVNANADDCVTILVQAVTRILTGLSTAVREGNHEVQRILGSIDFTGLTTEIHEEETENDIRLKTSSEEEGSDTGDSNSEDEIDEEAIDDAAPTKSEALEASDENNNTEEITKQLENTTLSADPEANSPTRGEKPDGNAPIKVAVDAMNIEDDRATSPAYQNIIKEPVSPKQEAPTSIPETPTDINAGASVVPSPIRHNPAFPGYQNYQDFRKTQAAAPSSLAETMAPTPQYTHTPAVSETEPTTGHRITPLSESGPVPIISQPSATIQAASPAAPVTLADQIQAYQSTQEHQASPAYPLYQNYQSYQGYQRPARKPLSSGSAGVESPKQEAKMGNEHYPGYPDYQNYQGYQGQQQSYQTPPPSQTFSHPNQGYQSPPLNQGYQTPPVGQGYAPPPPPSSSNEVYQATAPVPEYQPQRLPQQYQGYQNIQPVLSYAPPDTTTIPGHQSTSNKSSIGNRISSYFQGSSSSPDQQSQSTRYKFSDSWK